MKNLKKVSCQNKEQALREINDFINKGCEDGSKHDFHKVSLVCKCSKCDSTFTVDENIMKVVNVERILDDKNFKIRKTSTFKVKEKFDGKKT